MCLFNKVEQITNYKNYENKTSVCIGGDYVK